MRDGKLAGGVRRSVSRSCGKEMSSECCSSQRQSRRHLLTSRLRSCRVSPPRRSSPLKTRGCLVSCARPWNAKPPPQRCSRSSPVLLGSSSRFFSKMLENAARICEAKFGTLVLSEGGGKFRVVAMHGAPLEWAEKRTREPVFTPGPLNNIAIVARTKKVQHVPDLRRDRSYLDEDQAAMALADIAG